ncbi:MAG TPA: hypothetical protein VMF31_07175 [Solirubrobacterales bacterium]|nr:hypothetical protein [Solirubrobacterales bacterium]
MLGLIVTGPPGAGKSSTATKFHDELGDEGIANALIEIDELERSYPAIGRERSIHHLGQLCASYRELEPAVLTVTATIEDDGYLSDVITALGADETFVVRLEAGDRELERRIREREPEGWSGLDELVESSALLAATMPGLSRIDLVLDTEALSPDEVVADIRAAWPPAAGAIR